MELVNDAKIVGIKGRAIKYPNGLAESVTIKTIGSQYKPQKQSIGQSSKNSPNTAHGKALSFDLQQRLKLLGGNGNTASISIKLIK